MTVSDARAAAKAVLEQLPQEVHDALEHVTVQVVERTPPGVPSDVKGIFLGRQQVGGPEEGEEDDAGDAGEHYDLGPDGELELVAVGDGVPAEGEIYLVASNLAGPADLQVTTLHEISHALGMSEQEAEELGLG